jgi:NAD(P)-dependent dehydrogenase (short-subunit alcohol dehydrogenase family)
LSYEEYRPEWKSGDRISCDIVSCLADCGADIAVTCRNMEKANQAVKLASELGVRSKAYQLDIIDEDMVNMVFMQIKEDFKRIDILVANTGKAGGEGLRYVDTSEMVVKSIIDVNMNGTGYCIKAAVNAMLQQKFGRIIVISSTGARQGTVAAANYSVSKSLLLSMVQSVAQAHGKDDIHANCICPGYVRTEMWDKGIDIISKKYNISEDKAWEIIALNNTATHISSEPENIGAAVAFLVSDLAK